MKNRRDETYVQRILGAVFGALGLLLIVAAVTIHLAVYKGPLISPYMWSDGSFIASFTLFQIGLPFFLLGLAFSVWAGARRRRIRRLIEEGDTLTAEIEDIVPNYNVRVYRSCPYNLMCSWRDTRAGITYHFRSGNLWANPARTLEERGIKTVTVYVKRGNLRKYYVAVPGFDERDVYL